MSDVEIDNSDLIDGVEYVGMTDTSRPSANQKSVPKKAIEIGDEFKGEAKYKVHKDSKEAHFFL